MLWRSSLSSRRQPARPRSREFGALRAPKLTRSGAAAVLGVFHRVRCGDRRSEVVWFRVLVLYLESNTVRVHDHAGDRARRHSDRRFVATPVRAPTPITFRVLVMAEFGVAIAGHAFSVLFLSKATASGTASVTSSCFVDGDSAFVVVARAVGDPADDDPHGFRVPRRPPDLRR